MADFDLFAESDQEDASGYRPEPATERDVLEWYKRVHPDRYLRVLRAFEQAAWQRARAGNGKR